MKLKSVILLVAVLAVSITAALAQGNGGPLPPTAVPIDGGLSLLAAAGGAFALRKLRGR